MRDEIDGQIRPTLFQGDQMVEQVGSRMLRGSGQTVVGQPHLAGTLFHVVPFQGLDQVCQIELAKHLFDGRGVESMIPAVPESLPDAPGDGGDFGCHGKPTHHRLGARCLGCSR